MAQRRVHALFASVALLGTAGSARAQGIDGAALVRLLGGRAQNALASRGSGGIGALVRLPPQIRAADLGLTEAGPGFARLYGAPSRILSFADAHPGLAIEVAPPLHTLLDSATTFVRSGTANASGLDGAGVAIGIADLGLDVTHPDFLDASGHTRVAWLLDLAAPPLGMHKDLEQEFGSTDAGGNSIGAVWAAADIDARLAQHQTAQLPQDQVGHGTLVAACAAGNGVGGTSPYRGVAPRATLLVARISGASDGSIGQDGLLRGVGFLFDRAAALHLPVVVNLSVGTDFGPHDGTMAWEQVLASYVGPQHPGRAIVAAAGNSGSIDVPVHQNVYVAPGATVRVPVQTTGAMDGGVQVWVAMHAGAGLRVGLDGPDGTWIRPVASAMSAGKNTNDYNAAVYNGSQPDSSPVPAQSHGAVVIWQGHWPTGAYFVTLSGAGTADLWVQATGDAGAAGFSQGVREGTINLPATAPSIIGVGCTINKPSWGDSHGVRLKVVVPVLDAAGSRVDPAGAARDAIGGEPCWFSSAGPTLDGLQKPEILAPGAAIVGAMSRQAVPPAPSSIFTNPDCPGTASNALDQTCQQVDGLHAASFGTSFSAPLVAGTAALLLQQDPTMTQDRILAALQGGAHPLRGPFSFEDQLGAGELDVPGAVAAAARFLDPQVALPDGSASWLTLGADVALADGSTPLEAALELRTGRGSDGRVSPADSFDPTRLVPYALVDGAPSASAKATLVRRGPGVWIETVRLLPGLGGSTLTLGATFDGKDIVLPRSVPVAADVWSADYPASVRGGCAAVVDLRGATKPGTVRGWTVLGCACVWLVATRRRLRRTSLKP